MFKWLAQYFTFTKGERNAIVALVVLCTLALIIPRIYFYFKPAAHETNNGYLKQALAFNKEYRDSSLSADETTKSAQGEKANPKTETTPVQYFNFDPNKIGAPEWVKLGFTEKQALTIEHYKATGAKFYKPEDLKKLFVMTPEHYQALLPYVKIDKTALPGRNYHHND